MAIEALASLAECGVPERMPIYNKAFVQVELEADSE